MGVVVDTHVLRLSRRLELTKETEPVKVEQDLMKIIPQDHWIAFSHELIHHGRQICIARKPRCADCTLEKLCNSGGQDVEFALTVCGVGIIMRRSVAERCVPA